MISYKAAIVIALFWAPAALSEDDACLNDQDYKYDDGDKQRPCSNIRINEERRQTLCQLDEVRDACPQSCGICCDNDPDFEFTLENQPEVTQDCNWIIKNNVETRRTNYCTVQDFDQASGTTIRNMCPKACDFCKELVVQGPTEAPTKVPTKLPTKAPTKVPTKSPTKAPTKNPTKPPTKAPTKEPTTTAPTLACRDSPDFTFTLTLARTEVGCEWITRNANKITTRMSYCEEPAIETSCPQTCGGCTCEDDEDFMFDLDNLPGEKRGCDWITKNAGKIKTRQENYCSDVGESCPAACGLCDMM